MAWGACLSLASVCPETAPVPHAQKTPDIFKYSNGPAQQPELTASQRAQAIKRRKQIWEALHPPERQRVADLEIDPHRWHQPQDGYSSPSKAMQPRARW